MTATNTPSVRVRPAFTITVADVKGAKASARWIRPRGRGRLPTRAPRRRGRPDGRSGDAKFFPDIHPIAWLARFAPGFLQGKAEHDRRAISAHYDRESDFFLTFMDKRHRCYTQGVFASDDEPLEDAMTCKMDIAIEAIGARPGDHVLEVGGGWGRVRRTRRDAAASR